jgi:hypothetical protein
MRMAQLAPTSSKLFAIRSNIKKGVERLTT